MRAEKPFVEYFVPQIGTYVQVESDDCEVSAMVSAVWWRSQAESAVVIVHTVEQVYSDGDVDESKRKHIELLRHEGWLCTSR